jgi:hypothetical protein
MKADEGAVACRVDLSRRSSAKTEAKRRPKDGGEQVHFFKSWVMVENYSRTALHGVTAPNLKTIQS